MPEFTRVADVSEVPDPGKLLVEVDGEVVALFHVEDRFYAIDDICTHDGGPLGDGTLDGHEVACPRHGAKFDIRDGRAVTMPATKDTSVYKLQVRGDDVFVEIDD